MKKVAILIANIFTLFLFFQSSFGQNFGMEIIRYNGSPDQMVNLVVLGDGYTLNQQDKFLEDVKKNIDGMLLQSPWNVYSQKINVYAVKVVSNVSGAANRPDQPIDNYFGSSFYTLNIERLLYPTQINRILEVLNNHTPFFDIGLIMVNDERYGGGGGTFATFSTNSESAEIMIHELGHTFSSLADEYWAGSQYARETYNLTQTGNANEIRWKNFLNQNGIGIYAHEESPTWFRPHQNCKMRFLGRDFCMVCSNELRKKIESLTASTPLQWPLAFFGADNREIFEGQKVNFFDLSNEEPSAWEWTFEGGNPETSNLQNPTVTYPNVGVFQVSLKTSNSLGTSSINRSQYILVNKTDIEPPVIRLKNLTVNLNEMGKVKISPEEINDGTSDNVGIKELILSKTEFDCNDIGENEIIFKAIDINGNENSQRAIVTILDKDPPYVLTKNFTLMLDGDGKGVLLPEDIDNGSFDNCGIESRSLSKSNFTIEDNGENLVTLTVRDLYGNESSKTTKVRVDMILSNPEENNEDINISPNPTQGILQIEFPNNIGSSLKFLEIFSSNGNVIKTLKEIPENERLITIDVSEFSNGLYFVRLVYPDEIKSLKFILKK